MTDVDPTTFVPNLWEVIAERVERLARAERYVREHRMTGDHPLARPIAAWVSAGGPAPWDNAEETR